MRSTGPPPSQAAHRGDAGRHHRAVPLRVPRSGRRVVTERDPRFRGKVVVVDVFGTWCPTCHDAAPELVRLYRKYHDAAGSRSSGWRTRSPATPRWTARWFGATATSSTFPSPAAGRDQRHRGRGRHAAPAAGIHLVSHDDLPRPGRAGAARPRGVLRPGHGRAARESRSRTFEREMERLLAEPERVTRSGPRPERTIDLACQPLDTSLPGDS